MVSTPVLFRTFLGRSSELEHLLARRREAAAGRGGIVFVSGDAGIGKSRLVREFCARLPRRTTRIAIGAYREFAQRPLEPLLDILAHLDTRSTRLPNELAAGSRREYMAALVEAFDRVAAAGTTVIVLEDLHWADREGLQVLHALCERANSRRLLFVGTYRAGEIVPSHPNFSLIGRLLREHTISLVNLRPLVAKDVSELLRNALSGRASLPAALLDDVRRRCDGNAFFAEELLRYAIDHFEAGERVSASSMPVSLHAAVRDRLELCSAAARTLLLQAALFGRRFDLEIVRSIFSPAADERETKALLELVNLGLLEPGAEGSSDYRFRHSLLRDIVYAEIPAEERRSLHGRIGETIAARADAGRHAESLAHHFWHAGRLERAAPYCVAAAEAARAVHAYDDASDWYERASECFTADEDVARVLVAAGQVCTYTDRIDRALSFYRAAIERYARCERIDDVVITSVLTAASMYENGRSDGALALLDGTRRRWAALASPTVRDRLLLRLGFLFASARRVDEAWTCLEAIDEAGIDPASLLAAERFILKSGLHAQRAEPAPWRAAFERGFALFERLEAIPDNRRIALSNAASQAFNLGEPVLAREYQTRALELARAIRSNLDHERMRLAQLELHAGNLEAARSLLRETQPPDRFASRVERAILEAWFALLLGDDAAEGAPDFGLVAEAVSGGHTSALVRLACAFGPLLLRGGREREAEALFARAAAALETPFDQTFSIAALALFRPELITRVRSLVADAAGRKDDRVNRALLALLDAAVPAASIPDAKELARSAAREFGALGWPWLAAQADELAGDRKRALQCYRKIGAVGEIRRLERASIAREGGARRGGVLTPRERELARLVASGEGNRAAAKRLSITEKAVEKYLTSIYAKLGMASRVQLAAYVAERGADDSAAETFSDR